MFKVGDAVVCVNDRGWSNRLTEGSVYIVLQVRDAAGIIVVSDQGEDLWFSLSRFVPAPPQRG